VDRVSFASKKRGPRNDTNQHQKDTMLAATRIFITLARIPIQMDRRQTLAFGSNLNYFAYHQQD
jgi:hypothetical protein